MNNRKLVMIPGPTPTVESIQRQMSRKTAAFKDPDFVDDYKGVIEDLKEMWQTAGEVFVVPGTGSLAMEMAVSNVLAKGEELLIISNGYFGDRAAEIAEKKGYDYDLLSAEWGSTITADELQAKLAEKDFKAVWATHVDTSTGVKAPIEEFGQIIADSSNALFIVDGVCSTAAQREYVDPMNIDILLTGSQKAFGVAPGLAIVWAGPRAMAKREELKEISEYYVDFMKWLPVMKDPSQYFATPAVNLVWALQESLRLIKEEGLENRFERHAEDAEAIQAALQAMGFEILAEPECRAATLSNVLYPEEISDEEFRRILEEEGVITAGGLGDYAGKLFRLGHMGNIDDHQIVSVIEAIERALYRCDYDVEFGQGIKKFMEVKFRN